MMVILFLSSCSSMENRRELAEVYYNLGNAYNDLGKLNESANAYSKALVYGRNFPAAAHNLGIVLIESGRYREAVDVLEDLLRLEPENTVVMEILAWGSFMSGAPMRAVEVYESVLEIDQYNRDALNNISVILLNEGMYSEAYYKLLVLESLGESEANIQYSLGLCERELGISSGSDWFQAAYDSDSSSEKYLTALIDSLKEERKYLQASLMYEKLIGINPDPSIIFDRAFILLTALEDYSLGIPVLEKAMSSGFSDTEKIEQLKAYPDLLDKDRIISVLIEYPVQEPAAED